MWPVDVVVGSSVWPTCHKWGHYFWQLQNLVLPLLPSRLDPAIRPTPASCYPCPASPVLTGNAHASLESQIVTPSLPARPSPPQVSVPVPLVFLLC